MPPCNFSPQWEEVILDLLAHLLDPKTLAIASCVSKSWHSILSSDHIWNSLCLSHYPSIANYSSPSPVSPRRLFALLKSSSARRHRTPRAPRIALADLVFAVDLFCDDAPAFSAAVPGEELVGVCDQVFRFDVDVAEERRAMVTVDRLKSVRAVWNVVMKGWGGGFLMMDRTRKGRLVGLDEMWFSEELPGCCMKATGGFAGGFLVAELGFGLGVRGGGVDELRRVERVRFGLMSALQCRHVSVDDVLLYLQPFLLPSDV